MARILGSNQSETLSGTDLGDLINARGGDDTILMSTGLDHIDGGAGSDTMDYSTYGGELSIVLDGGNPTTVYGNGSAGDVLVNIENLTGGRRNDYFVGDDADNTFRGNGGHDYFVSSNGFDRYYGGAGYDMVDYSNTGIGIVITAPKHGVSFASGGGSDYDTLVGIERIIGTAFDDRISGGAANNEFYGGAGNDVLKGGAGGDVLGGEAGYDRLTGGADADIFVFSGDFGVDTVTDFHATGNSHDLLDVRGVATFGSFDSMLFGHRIWQDGHDVIIDAAKGNEIVLENVNIHDLSTSDFII